MSRGLEELMAALAGRGVEKDGFLRGEKIMKITIEGWEDEPHVIENVDEFFLVCADTEGKKSALGAAGPRILSLAAMEAIQRYVRRS